MSSIESQRRLLLEKKALDDLRERIGREAYLTVPEVQERLNLSRDKVEALPIEILPFADYGTPNRSLKRYHPADVLAVDARIRAWRAAQQRGEGEAYLRELREELEARDAAALEVARLMNAELSSAA